MDIRFIKRVYKTSIAVWLFALLACAAYRSATTASGITVGFAISLGSLMLIERLVTTLVRPEQASEPNHALRKLAFVAIIKYAFIGFAIWAALRSGWVTPGGLAIGIGLPYIVIFLKALGIWLSFDANPNRSS